jgi:23S rRNA (cytidine1920-2'-O)/16S rRNA (cytidine1409-2'-O)-methyltransferase
VKPKRVRLDQLVVERGFAGTRSRAQALLMAGRVRVGEGDGARADRKPGDLVDASIPLALVAGAEYVSRGGEKLVAGLDAFGVDPAGRICLDVGSSTGGFTDVLLRRGASRVYALDVGRGQLAESLRSDPRVVSLERTHVRRLDPAEADAVLLPERPSLSVIDVSFISLTRVLEPVVGVLDRPADLVVLVKPQFEATPKEVPKGVVRDPAVRAAALDRVRAHAEGLGLNSRGQVESPLVGAAGNVEFLLHLVAP